MHASTEQAEGALGEGDLGFPSADAMPGVLFDRPVSAEERELIDSEPKAEAAIRAEAARAKAEAERKAEDLKDLEALVQHQAAGDALLERHQHQRRARPPRHRKA